MVSAIEAVDNLAPIQERINALEIQMKAATERQYQLSDSIIRSGEKA